jgi:chaperonin GroEL
VVPLLKQALAEEAESLVIIAEKIEGEALGTLIANRDKLPLIPVKAPGLTVSRPMILEDLAVLTGGTVIDKGAGRSLERFQSDYFGRARRVIATRSDMKIVGPGGRPREIQKRRELLRAELENEDLHARPETLRKRLANLSGGMGILKIGAVSKLKREHLRDLAENAVRCVRAGLEEGVVPGGGAAYLACIPMLEALEHATGGFDEKAGVRVVAEGLSAPMAQIAINVGHPGSTTAARARAQGSGYGFEAVSGEIVEMKEAGILDPAKVVRKAVEMATSIAAQVLTTEAVVLSKRKTYLEYGTIT